MGSDYHYLLEDAQREYARRYKVLMSDLVTKWFLRLWQN